MRRAARTVPAGPAGDGSVGRRRSDGRRHDGRREQRLVVVAEVQSGERRTGSASTINAPAATPTVAACARRPGRRGHLGGTRSAAGVSSVSLWLPRSLPGGPPAAGVGDRARASAPGCDAGRDRDLADRRVASGRRALRGAGVHGRFPFVGAGRRGFGERMGMGRASRRSGSRGHGSRRVRLEPGVFRDVARRNRRARRVTERVRHHPLTVAPLARRQAPRLSSRMAPGTGVDRERLNGTYDAPSTADSNKGER